MRHLRVILFDARVHDKWSYEQLPMVQRIMNTVEKTFTGVTPAELILNNSIRLSALILAPPGLVVKSPYPTHWITESHDSIPSSQ